MSRRFGMAVAAVATCGAIAGIPSAEYQPPDSVTSEVLAYHPGSETVRSIGGMALSPDAGAISRENEVASSDSEQHHTPPLEMVPISPEAEQALLKAQKYTRDKLLPLLKKRGFKEFKPTNTDYDSVNRAGQVTITGSDPNCVLQVGISIHELQTNSKYSHLVSLDASGPKEYFDGKKYPDDAYAKLAHPDKMEKFPAREPQIAAKFIETEAGTYCPDQK